MPQDSISTYQTTSSIPGHKIGLKVGSETIKAFVESMIIFNQANGIYEVLGNFLKKYATKVNPLTKEFKAFKLQHIAW